MVYLIHFYASSLQSMNADYDLIDFQRFSLVREAKNLLGRPVIIAEFFREHQSSQCGDRNYIDMIRVPFAFDCDLQLLDLRSTILNLRMI